MKNWLEEKKIYFETVSAFLLSMMAIIVSVISIKVSQAQLENTELLNQPLIKVSNDVFSYGGEEDDSRFLIIENEGTPITNYSSKLYSFLKVEAFEHPYSSTKSEYKTTYVPIGDYFGGRIPSNNFTGVIEKYIGLKNYKLVSNLEDDFKDNFSDKHPQTFISLVQYLEMNFKDYKGDQNKKLFSIDLINSGQEIEKSQEIQELLNFWNSEQKLYIYNLSSEDIRKLIIEKGS